VARSADPAAELPGLILALDGRYGPASLVTRIMVGMAGWDPSRRAGCRSAAWRGRRVVRLGWFATMPAGLLTATCARGQRTGLLTVPPHTGKVPRTPANRPPGRPWARPATAATPGSAGRRQQVGQPGRPATGTVSIQACCLCRT
jgi:Family of unknown function (DUF5994)